MQWLFKQPIWRNRKKKAEIKGRGKWTKNKTDFNRQIKSWFHWQKEIKREEIIKRETYRNEETRKIKKMLNQTIK